MNFSAYTIKESEEVLSEFKVLPSRGLGEDEVRSFLDRYGPNVLKSEETYWWQLLLRQFRSVFIYMLVLAAGLAFLLGQRIDGTMILAFVLLNSSLGFYQEYRSEKTLRLLKQFTVSRARVIRQGKEKIIKSSGLVPGDLVIIEPGDIIPADLRLFEENNLLVDESILTGESAPVKKTAAKLKQTAKETYRAQNIVFSGTTAVGGKAKGVVIATGDRTEIGKISHLMRETVRLSSFTKGIDRFSKFILRLVIVTLVFVFIANLFIKGSQANLTELIIFSIALAVSVIPEALPVVITFSLSRGALRLAKNKVIVKRLSAIEDLGSIEVLCTDKTGTLTENSLTVDRVYAASGGQPLFSASLAAPFLREKKEQPNNAFDLALWHKLSAEKKKEILGYQRLAEEPFDPERRRNSLLVKKENKIELLVRGAPEEIINLCSGLKQSEINNLNSWMAELGERGQRIIAVARKELSRTVEDLIKEEHKLRLEGLISFIDPLKATTKEAVAKAKKLGVKVKILTGDKAEVAGWVAYQVGLVDNYKKVISGEELDRLSPADQHKAIEQYNVFARVSPQQKYRIIQLLQEKNEVGFLGEGINDAPALKIANVALAVEGAADIAREAADIVLLKKNLKVIIDGIQEGRIVFNNTIKYIKATLSSNFGNFYAVAIASLFIDYLPMLPLQILLVNLLSDFPMIAIAADNVDADELKKPKSYNVKEIALVATLLGIVSTIFDFIFFALFYRHSPQVLQTNWFIGSILTELLFLYSIRTQFFFLKAKRPPAALLWLSAVALGVTIFMPFSHIGQEFFRFVAPTAKSLTLILIVVVSYFITTETVKLLYYKFSNFKEKRESAGELA